MTDGCREKLEIQVEVVRGVVGDDGTGDGMMVSFSFSSEKQYLVLSVNL